MSTAPRALAGFPNPRHKHGLRASRAGIGYIYRDPLNYEEKFAAYDVRAVVDKEVTKQRRDLPHVEVGLVRHNRLPMPQSCPSPIAKSTALIFSLPKVPGLLEFDGKGP
ncbi:hypothetical protein [Streptomyces sp. NPDC004546]|uniref:hypothetical protein n=1 Tax=Streptomyces sp. NPDC004546 TaxID=3154282 RepID=UPI0033BBDC48